MTPLSPDKLPQNSSGVFGHLILRVGAGDEVSCHGILKVYLQFCISFKAANVV